MDNTSNIKAIVQKAGDVLARFLKRNKQIQEDTKHHAQEKEISDTNAEIEELKRKIDTL